MLLFRKGSQSFLHNVCQDLLRPVRSGNFKPHCICPVRCCPRSLFVPHESVVQALVSWWWWRCQRLHCCPRLKRIACCSAEMAPSTSDLWLQLPLRRRHFFLGPGWAWRSQNHGSRILIIMMMRMLLLPLTLVKIHIIVCLRQEQSKFHFLTAAKNN